MSVYEAIEFLEAMREATLRSAEAITAPAAAAPSNHAVAIAAAARRSTMALGIAIAGLRGNETPPPID